MKSILALMLTLIITSCSSSENKQEELSPENFKSVKAMTFNIRNGKAKDGDNHWHKRKHMVFKVLQDYAPDFCGMQEAFDFQISEITKAVPEYKSLGEARDGGSLGEYSNILYRSKVLEPLESGTFWLSDTPEKKSKSFGNNLHRICTWALFKHKVTGKQFYVYNTHFDHRSVPSRVQSSRLIIDKIKSRKFKEYPFILTGDFNAISTSLEMNYFSSNNILDTDRFVSHKDQNRGTFSGFKYGSYKHKIDYIFIKERQWKVEKSEIIRYSENNKYPSDHFPVFTELTPIEKKM